MIEKDSISKKEISEGRLFDLGKLAKALLIGVYKTSKDKAICEANLNELKNLADTFGLETKIILPTPLKKIESPTFLGKGKVQEVKKIIEENNIDIVIFDDEIAPHQQRNLEKEYNTIVIDRTELIIGVFYRHARSKEAKLQVKLAQSRYQLPRLKRMWTHLSRQKVGGASGGFLKGEGEKQIEIDKRILKTNITQLQDKINQVKKTRTVQRSQREKLQVPTFAIIGYTNAGKSTLLNALTNAGVLVEDKLFATLDTTTRKYKLPNNQDILLIDTVGFIRKIPHTLVAAFKSTLEESFYADILIHLVDISDVSAQRQMEASLEVLKELNVQDKPLITVLNKIDKCEDEKAVFAFKLKYPSVVTISALKQEGFSELIEKMVQEIARLRKKVKLKIPQSAYSIFSLVLKYGKVLSQDYEENYILVEAEVSKNIEAKLKAYIVD